MHANSRWMASRKEGGLGETPLADVSSSRVQYGLNLGESPNSEPTHSVSMALFVLESLFSPLLLQAWGLLAALENWLWAQGAKPT